MSFCTSKVLQYFLKPKIINYCNSFSFKKVLQYFFKKKKMILEPTLSHFWTKILKFSKKFVSKTIRAYFICFKIILTLVILIIFLKTVVFMIKFFIVHYCYKNIEVLQYCNIAIFFLNPIYKHCKMQYCKTYSTRSTKYCKKYSNTFKKY